MSISENAEDLLESIWIQIFEQKKIPDVSILKDNSSFKELIDNKFVFLNPKLQLTDDGKNEGELCVRRHRLAERLLTDVLHVKAQLVHETGCKFEHILQKGLEDNICILLGHPKKCPHGKPIPKGKCCLEKQTDLKSLVRSLKDFKKGEKGKIAYIHSDDQKLISKVMAMGFFPGTKVTLINNHHSIIFQIRNTKYAIDKKMAEIIYVWSKKE